MPRKAPRPKARWWVRTIKILLWTAMATALLVFGSLMVCVKVLTPQHLTPIAEMAANRMLNADVSIGRIELSLKKSSPFLNIDIDSLTIVATDVSRLAPEDRNGAPLWADTLLTVDHLRGGINLAHIVLSRITLSDVLIHRPAVNIAIIRSDVNNFNIFPTSPTDTTKTELPPIAIRRFAIVDPRPFRYIDAESGARVTLAMRNVTISGNDAPLYSVDFDSEFLSPLLDEYHIKGLPVRFGGGIEWNQENVYALALRDFIFGIGAVSGAIDTKLDFQNNLVINTFEASLNPIDVKQALALVPDTLWRGTGFDPSQLRTDMSVSLAARLNKPFVADAQIIPDATVSVRIPDCSLAWKMVNLRKFGLEVDGHFKGDDLDKAVVDVKRLFAQGPATDLTIKGKLTNLVTDPIFDGRVEGHTELANLPPAVARLAEGSLRGRLTASANIRASRSMLSIKGFHKLKIDGDVDLDNFLYERYDTVTFVDLHHVCFKFDSNKNVKKGDKKIDHLLSASIDVDTANIVHSDLKMKVGGFRIAVGALNDGTSAKGDTTLIIPMGGGIKVNTFSLITLTDTFSLRMRDTKGNLVMQRYRQQSRVPEFTAYLNIGRISTGDKSTRVLLSNSTLRFNTHKVSARDRVPEAVRKRLDAISDSLKTVMPNIPTDSIYAMAMRHYRSTSHTRVTLTDNTADGDEVIDWDTSNMLSKFLKGWDFKGTLSSDHVRLFTHYFPVRNRMTNLNVAFNNDSIVFDNVKYKAGHSDFLMSGKISNIRRALTSRRRMVPLKINFDLLSDTIDINQLAKATFDGAAYSEKAVSRRALTDSDEERLETFIEDHTTAPNDTMAPVLVPVNIDAELKVRARNVAYADIMLHDLSGTVLIYDGAVNLNNVSASSRVGSIDLSALYSAPNQNDMKFGLGLKVNKFNIAHFLDLVPAVDSIMPIMRNFSGIINANIAATTLIDKHMNLEMPTLKANIDLSGDSLVVIDPDTYKTISKWLLFKNKNRNLIDHMSVQMMVENNTMQVFPFIFDFDRYRLGVQGYNDLDMNFKYHVAVLKSPIPFKFGINISGNPDKYKIRLGGANFNEKEAVSYKQIVEDSRVNLLEQIQGVFRRGVRKSRFADLKIDAKPVAREIDLAKDTISAADSLLFIREGLIPAPPVDTLAVQAADKATDKKKRKDKKKK